MELAARRYAIRVLLIHLGLLILLLALVALAVRYLYLNAKAQAIEHARQTQELLAKQTALGISNYYESVTGVLNLLQPPEGAAASQPVHRQPEGSRPTASPRRADRVRELEREVFARLSQNLATPIWKSIQDKASALFVVDPQDDFNIVRIIGPDSPTLDLQAAIDQAKPFLQVTQRRSVSPFVMLDGQAAHLVCVPMRGPGGLMMIAVVPVKSLDRDVLQFVQNSDGGGTHVTDDIGTFISSFIPALIGQNVKSIPDPRIKRIAEQYLKQGRAGTEIFDQVVTMGDVSFKPSMSTIQPADVLGTRWYVVMSANLGRVEQVVDPIFRDAMTWAGVVMLGLTAILVSTAFQMIRTRARLERSQMEIINRELKQARQIQLNWLPLKKCSDPKLDVAALNLPASHISGDFYNWFALEDGRTVITIGDVTGHGMAAAFLMATTQLLVRNVMPRVIDPGKCLEEVNRHLCTQAFNGQFVSMQILLIDSKRGELVMVNAGHPPPMMRSDHRLELMQVEPELVLGVDREATYPSQRFPTKPGSSMLLYTDGLPDVIGPNEVRLTTSRIPSLVDAGAMTSEAWLSALETEVLKFRAGTDLADDLTAVMIRFG